MKCLQAVWYGPKAIFYVAPWFSLYGQQCLLSHSLLLDMDSDSGFFLMQNNDVADIMGIGIPMYWCVFSMELIPRSELFGL